MKEKLKIIEALIAASKTPKWMSPDLVIYISDYMEQHPNKKLTRRLEYKLKHEYYSTLRKSRK